MRTVTPQVARIINNKKIAYFLAQSVKKNFTHGLRTTLQPEKERSERKAPRGILSESALMCLLISSHIYISSRYSVRVGLAVRADWIVAKRSVMDGPVVVIRSSSLWSRGGSRWGSQEAVPRHTKFKIYRGCTVSKKLHFKASRSSVTTLACFHLLILF